MVAQIKIGDNTAGKFKCYIGDGAQAEADTYGWFFTPSEVIMAFHTKDIVKDIIPLDNNYAIQAGSFNVIVQLRNILISAVGASTAYTQFNLWKEAIFQWATGYTGDNIEGELLKFQGYDQLGNEWSRLPNYAHPTAAEFGDVVNTYGILTTKLTELINIAPLPNGDYLIKQLQFSLFRAITEVA